MIRYNILEIFVDIYISIFTSAHQGLVIFTLFVQYSQSDLQPLRPLCGDARAEPGTGNLEAGMNARNFPYIKYNIYTVYTSICLYVNNKM